MLTLIFCSISLGSIYCKAPFVVIEEAQRCVCLYHFIFVVFLQTDVKPHFLWHLWIIQQTLEHLIQKDYIFLSDSTSDLLLMLFFIVYPVYPMFFLGSPNIYIYIIINYYFPTCHQECSWPGLCQWWLWSPGTQQPIGGDPMIFSRNWWRKWDPLEQPRKMMINHDKPLVKPLVNHD